MTIKPPRKNATGTRGRPFQPGNPGRPKGARNKATRAVEVLLEGQAAALTRRAIQAALAGDVTALRLCLDRIAPVAKERAVTFDLPAMKSAADVPEALAVVVRSVSIGELTPSEGATVAALVERFRAAHQGTKHEREFGFIDDLCASRRDRTG
ncbi:MAG: DUF5681 domain-containing protein [Caulobacteraceae bacterium]